MDKPNGRSTFLAGSVGALFGGVCTIIVGFGSGLLAFGQDRGTWITELTAIHSRLDSLDNREAAAEKLATIAWNEAATLDVRAAALQDRVKAIEIEQTTERQVAERLASVESKLDSINHAVEQMQQEIRQQRR